MATFQAFFNIYDDDLTSKLFRIRFSADEKHLLIHTRPGGGRRWSGFIVWDIEKRQQKADLGTWVAQESDRFSLSDTGNFVINGDDAYDITRFDLASGKSTVLFNCHEELSSHYLETCLSADGGTLAVWSSEREKVLFYEVASGERFHIERAPYKHGREREFLGLNRDGRYAFLRHDKGFDVVDLKYRKTARSIDEPYLALGGERGLQMSSDGNTCLAIQPAEKKDGPSTVRILRQKQP